MPRLAIAGCGLRAVRALGAAAAVAASEAGTPEPRRLPPARFSHVQALRTQQL